MANNEGVNPEAEFEKNLKNSYVGCSPEDHANSSFLLITPLDFSNRKSLIDNLGKIILYDTYNNRVHIGEEFSTNVDRIDKNRISAIIQKYKQTHLSKIAEPQRFSEKRFQSKPENEPFISIESADFGQTIKKCVDETPFYSVAYRH